MFLYKEHFEYKKYEDSKILSVVSKMHFVKLILTMEYNILQNKVPSTFLPLNLVKIH